jgi:PAS domain-containing protein
MSPDSTESDKRITLLERRFKREKNAREQAEALLREKSQRLYDALKTSQQSQADLELALWASQESFWSWRADTDVMEIRSFSLYSGNSSTWSGTVIELMKRVHQDDIENLQFHWSMAIHGNRDRIEVSFRLRFKADYQWIRLRGRVLERGSATEALNIVGTTKDITQQRKAEQSFDLMASAFASSREPMLVLTPDLVITECNDAFIRLLEAPVKEKCIGENFNELLAATRVNEEQLMLDKQLRFESKIDSLSGKTRVVDISIAVFEAYRQTSSYLIATLRDVSDRKRNEARLRQLAQHDDLTGLSNRNWLRESIDSYVASDEPFLLVFLDLDGFKAINDTAGHDKGDAELQRVAALLTAMFGPIGEVGRWGG